VPRWTRTPALHARDDFPHAWPAVALMQRVPARPEAPVDTIDTPALVVDLDILEANLDAMAATVRAAGLRLRPHAKSHKCPAIAAMQVARGAVGVCCQKTDEAAALVDAGIGDVLVTNEVVAPVKLARLAELARRARVGVLCDDARAVPLLSGASTAAGATLDVYVEADVGGHRCGVAPGEAVGELARAIADAPGLRFAGLHCYQGAAQHLRTPPERRAAIEAATRAAVASRDACVARGLRVDMITGAGTGTFEHEIASGVWTELQPGSYPFMDVDYARNVTADGAQRFRQSLFVLAGVMSTPAPTRAICDAGLKAFAFDSGLPQVADRDGVAYVKASDEHGVLDVPAGNAASLWGARIRLVPGHVDPTFNLYDFVVGCRGERVEAVWPVARGTLG
jgi:D-serine deaminase-like pyridoxal phosphate-dependent protein